MIRGATKSRRQSQSGQALGNDELNRGLSEPQIPIISGLRAVAVFLVIFFHLGIEWMPGGTGVLIFFVISGFLITWLLLKENSRKGSVSLRRFYARRTLRIFPAFYVYAAITLALLIGLHKHVDWPQTVAALLYYANYYQAIHGDPGTAFSHTWSLGIEEQFYLCWPALFYLLRNRPNTLMRVTGSVIAAVWIYRFILKFVFHVWQGYFYEAFDTRMDHLLIGCLLAMLLFYSRGHRGWLLICGRPIVTAVTVALLVVSVLAELRWTDLYRDTWGFIANPLLCALLIPQLISLRALAFVGWLDWGPVKYLGSISYSLYLYQQLLLEPVQKALKMAPRIVQSAGSIAVLIVVASASYWIVEKPFLRIKKRLQN
ncbi:MAG: acyltransferase family protein [Bryobacteraceae bacterium]